MKIYLVRQHLHVGDEYILAAHLTKSAAEEHARELCASSNTHNFDVVEIEEGHHRND